MSLKKPCVTRAVYAFLCKLRLLLPLQIDHVVLGFLLLTVVSCLLCYLDTVLTCFLGRPPVLQYLLHLPVIPQGGRWDMSLQNSPWRAWGWTGLEEQSRDEAGRSYAVGQSWEGTAFPEASSPHLFKVSSNSSSTLHWDALSFLKIFLALCMYMIFFFFFFFLDLATYLL